MQFGLHSVEGRPSTTSGWAKPRGLGDSHSTLPDPAALEERPPSFLSPRTPRLRIDEDERPPPRERPEWCTRHHVSDSRRNVSLPANRRMLFDVLPHLRVRQGAYSDVPLYVVGDINDDTGSYEDVLKWKWMNFPHFARPSTGRIVRPAVELPVLNSQMLEPGIKVAESASASSSPRKVPQTPRRLSAKAAPAVRTARVGPPELIDFLRWCETKHGHLVNTWRKLDQDGNMTLTKPEFLKGLREMGYSKDGQKLWSIFTDEEETLTFILFVPDLAIDLARFKHWTEEQFHGVKAAFRAFDGNGNGKLCFSEFMQACEKFGMWQRLKEIVHVLFIMLDDGNTKDSRGVITEKELDFLERWRCPPYLWADPDFAAKKQFWKHMLSVYKDNPLIAWRKALDKDGNMKVSYSEFYKACAKLLRAGVLAGSLELVNRIYITFDSHRSGYISLRRWDSTCYQLLYNFTLWTRREFGKVSNAVAAWEKETGGGVSLGAFRKGAEGMGMSEEELRLLFSGLSLEGATSKAGRISRDEMLFLDKWDPEKRVQEELAWEKMVGSRFSSSRSRPSAASAFKRMSLKASAFAAAPTKNTDDTQDDMPDGFRLAL